MFKQEIQDVVDLVGEEIGVEYDKNINEMFYYHLEKRRISFNLKSYIKYYNQNFKPLGIALKENIVITTLHEIGHHKDEHSKIKKEEKEMSFFNKKKENLPYRIQREKDKLEMEKNAWKLAYDLNQRYQLVSNDLFSIIRKHSLDTYLNEFKIVVNQYYRGD